MIESLSLGLSQRNLPLVELENDSGTVTGQAAVAEYSQGLRETWIGPHPHLDWSHPNKLGTFPFQM